MFFKSSLKNVLAETLKENVINMSLVNVLKYVYYWYKNVLLMKHL